VLVRFANGVTGTFDVSRVAAGRRYRIDVAVDGTRGAIAWSSESANQLWLGFRDQPNQLLLRDPSLLAEPARRYASYAGAYAEGFADTLKQMVASVYASIENRAHPGDFATFAEGHRAMLVHEAVARSAGERRWVTVEDED
jgi:predicted dehydrogenase